MSSTLQTFGFRPVYSRSGGQVRAKRVKLADSVQAGTAVNHYAGNPCTLKTDGSLIAYDGTGSAYNTGMYGIVAGFEYTDANNKPVKDNKLLASQTGITNVYAWVYTDPDIVYEVGVNATVAIAAIGDQLTTVTNPTTGSSTTGYGTCYMAGAGSGGAATLAGANAQGVARIIDIALQPDNDWSDNFTVVQVELCGLQTVAVKVAI